MGRKGKAKANAAPGGGGGDEEAFGGEAFGDVNIELSARLAAQGLRPLEGSAASRGRGVETARAFAQGEVLLREGPLCLLPSRVATLGGVDAHWSDEDVAAVRAANASMKPADRRLLASFEAGMERLPDVLAAAVDADETLRPLVHLARVARLNAHEHASGKIALYPLVARANHSCEPCCGLAAGADGQLIFYALRDMEAGEELEYSYLGGHFCLFHLALRRQQLLRAKLFECRCARCEAPESLESSDGPARTEQYERLEASFSKKAAGLEALWADPAKDVGKYISDWEALAGQCGKLLGTEHAAYGRACFFALQALNTGRTLNIGGVTAERFAVGARVLALPLVVYLKGQCSLGVRRAAMEPVGRSLVLLQRDGGEGKSLAAEIVALAGQADLATSFHDDGAMKPFTDMIVSLVPSA